MKKRILSIVLVLCMVCTLLPVAAIAANGVDAKIQSILNDFPSGTYFTANGQGCGHSSGSTCDNCKLSNVLRNRGIKYDSSIFLDGWTCYGFASYCFGTIFNQRFDKAVGVVSSGYVSSNAELYNAFKLAKTGDFVYCFNGDSISHYAIFISCDSNGVTLLHNNIGGGGLVGRISYGYIPYDSLRGSGYGYNRVDIYRATNYDDISAITYSEKTTLSTFPGSGSKICSSEDIEFSWSQTSSSMTGYNLYIAKQISGTTNYDFGENSRIYIPGVATTSYVVPKGGRLSAGAYAAYVQPWNQYTNEKGEISNFVYFVVYDDIIIGVNDPSEKQTYNLTEINKLQVRGFSINTGKKLTICYASIDDGARYKLDTVSRPDVQNSILYSSFCLSDMVGFVGYIPIMGLSTGEHTVHIFVESSTCLKEISVAINIIKIHTHSYTSKVIAPTCTAPGYTTYTCSCGESYKDNYTDALGHNYVSGKCTRCGTSDPNYNPIVLTDIDDLIASFKQSIAWAVQKNITTGYADGTFKPNATCTRGHVVTFLWRAAGSPEPKTTRDFSDVSESSPFYKAIMWAAEQGITTGYADGTFRPNDACTRAHVVTFLWRYEGKPASSGNVSLVDLSGLNADFTSAINWAASKGITTGYSDGTFRPHAVCTRAHVVTFLYRDMT